MDKRRLFYGRNKVIFAGGIYHITQRATGAELLFLEQADYLYMLHILKETVKKYNLDLFAFALMPNHIHLLLRINEENLKEAMHNLFTRYGIYFNKKYQRKGHVFCSNYRAALCLDDGYLLTASLYIHANPYRAKLTNSVFEYRWSSINLYNKADDRDAFINYRFILNMLNSDIDRAVKVYREMMLDFLKLQIDTTSEPHAVIRKLKFSAINILQKIAGSKCANKKLKQEMEFNNAIKGLTERKKVFEPKEREARLFLINQLLANCYSVQEIADLLQVNRTTIHRLVNKAKQ
ncbi:MAG: transposase [Candidatus Omnitrophica bacterium]|nr:transposase [Candidatus Omnitrophota bacterium]